MRSVLLTFSSYFFAGIFICSVPGYSQQPTVITKKADISKDFTIALFSDSLSVLYKKRILPITTSIQLDKYLKNNLSDIDRSKVVIRNTIYAKEKYFEEVLAVLKKYNIYHFSMITDAK
jgi:hypothetical protein